MADVGALDQVRTFLREHPDLHRQRSWVCGTAACVAGWTVALDEGLHAGQDVEELVWQPRVAPGGRGRRSLAADAARILDLTDDEAEVLFRYVCTERAALELLDALVAREKGDLTDEQRDLLDDYCLWPAA